MQGVLEKVACQNTPPRNPWTTYFSPPPSTHLTTLVHTGRPRSIPETIEAPIGESLWQNVARLFVVSAVDFFEFRTGICFCFFPSDTRPFSPEGAHFDRAGAHISLGVHCSPVYVFMGC